MNTISTCRQRPQSDVSPTTALSFQSGGEHIAELDSFEYDNSGFRSQAYNPGKPHLVPRKPTNVFRTASFNVENLFDDIDDPNTTDESTPAKTPQDMQKLARALMQADADVVSLQEVENIEVLQQFLDDYLPGMYPYIALEEGNDQRGIDVAVISRHPISSVVSHKNNEFLTEEGKKCRFRRDFLRVDVQVGKYPFSVYTTHLKAQAGGARADHIRLAEAKEARRLVQQDMRRCPGRRFVVTGDFNDVPQSCVGQVFMPSQPGPRGHIGSKARELGAKRNGRQPTPGAGSHQGDWGDASLAEVGPSSRRYRHSWPSSRASCGQDQWHLHSALGSPDNTWNITHPATFRTIDYLMFPDSMEDEFVGGGVQQLDAAEQGSDHYLIYGDFRFSPSP